MDTELLKTFLEVGRTRHFGKAAENLYLTQSAVSARIRQLELQIGSALFVRDRNNIRLTPAGDRLRPHADAILTAWHRAQQDVTLHPSQSLQIAIGATPNAWDIMLQERISRVFSNHPSISVRAESLSPETLSRRLLERTLDLAVMFDPPKVDELRTEVLGHADLVMVSSISGSGPANYIPNAAQWIVVDWGTRFGIELSKALPGLPIPALFTNSLRIALDFLLRSGGYTYLPHIVAAPYIESGDLFLIDSAPAIRREIFAALHECGEHQSTLRTLIDQISDSGSGEIFGQVSDEVTESHSQEIVS